MLKKIISAVSAVCVMAVSGVIPQPASAAGSQMRNWTTAEIVRDMGIGINLGILRRLDSTVGRRQR